MKFLRSIRIWIVLTIFIGLFFLRYQPFIILFLFLCTAAIYNVKTLYPLKNYKFWIVIILLVLVVPIFTGSPDKTIIGISYSSSQLQKTILMTIRGISIFLLFQVLTIDLNIEKIKPLLSKIGLNNFDFLFKLSKEIFPKIKSILNARYTQFKINWQNDKSFNLIFVLFNEVFIDFFLLIDQLSKTEKLQKVITPKSFLESIKFSDKSNLIIVAGDAGTGKTPWVEGLIKLLKIEGYIIDGIISKKHKKSEDNWFHDLIRISTDEKLPLTTMDKINTDIKVGKFNVYKNSITWGNQQLASITNSNWIIIDEIGLLEFDGGGFLPGLKKVASESSINIIITMRTSLLQHLDDFIYKNIPELKKYNRQIIYL